MLLWNSHQKTSPRSFQANQRVQAAILETIATTYSGIEAHEPAKQFLSYCAQDSQTQPSRKGTFTKIIAMSGQTVVCSDQKPRMYLD